MPASKGDTGFRRAGRLVYRTQMRYPWPVAGPGRATSGRPTLQTSSNQHDLNRLARTSVTNVVNLSPKTTIISEKALRLTTFVTTDQSTPNTQHARPLRHPQEAAGPGRASRRRAKPHASTPGLTGAVGAEGQAAVPVGGGGVWPGFEATHPATRQRHSAAGVEGAGGSGGHGRASRRGAERSEDA